MTASSVRYQPVIADRPVPDGWLLCDGRFIAKGTYRDLELAWSRNDVFPSRTETHRLYRLPDMKGRVMSATITQNLDLLRSHVAALEARAEAAEGKLDLIKRRLEGEPDDSLAADYGGLVGRMTPSCGLCELTACKPCGDVLLSST